RPDPSLVAARDPETTAEAAAYEESQAEAQRPFVPAAAERPVEAQPRMPRVEDFPAIAQRQLKARSGGAAPEEDRRPRSLLARLAHGLARRDEYDEEPAGRAAEPASRPAPMQIEPRADMAEQARTAAPQPASPRAPAPQPLANAYARPAAPQPRRQPEPLAATGTYDAHGRAIPADSRRDDDQLDIPAFLRRQSS
ncbi:MAG TPA: hypothetical protein VHG92_04925, partial [Afifellaceae bacterium]|nr:hypothetical protein [Afifellaceae bacterium]